MGRPYQRTISLPKQIVDEVEDFLTNSLIGNRYTSIGDFVKEAIREKLSKLEEEEERLRRLKYGNPKLTKERD